MSNFFKKSRMILVLLLFIGIICASIFSSGKVKAETVEYNDEVYQLKYDADTLTVLLTPSLSKYTELTKADLTTFKDRVKDVLIQAITDDVDLSQYGYSPKGKFKGAMLFAPTPFAYGDEVDMDLINQIMGAQLGSVEKINENFLGGTSYDLLIKFYIDRYTEGFVTENVGTTEAEVLDEIQTLLTTAIVNKVEAEYNNASMDLAETTLAKDLAADRVEEIVGAVKTLKDNDEKVEVTLNDVKDIINTVEITDEVIDYVKSIDAKTEINEIIMNSTADDITAFLTEVDTDTLINTVKETEIMDSDDVIEIVNTVGVENLITIADTISLDKLADLADAVNLNKDDLTEAINENLDDITIADLLKLMKSLTVDGEMVYSKENGFSVTAIKNVIKNLPRPSEIMNFTDDEMNVQWAIEVETTFGTISTNLKVGFFGDSSNIRKLAEIVANHVSFNNVDGTYTLELFTGEKFGELAKKFLNNNYISNELKQRAFDVFDSDIQTLYNKFNNTSLNEYIDLLKQVDYKALLNKVLDGETISHYLGITVSNTQIDKAIDFVLKLARKLEGKTYADVLDFLSDYIDTTKLENETLESLFNYVLKVINKVDDGTLSSTKIREWLESDTTTNESVYTRIDKLANYESTFNKLKEYVTRIYNRLPERYLDNTIAEYYASANTFDFAAELNITKIIELLPSKVEDAINVLFTGIPERVSVRLVAEMPHIYKITYVYGTEQKVGFLPAGTNIGEYINVTTVNGVELQGWNDEDDNPVTVMPERDITVTAVAQMLLSVSDDVSRTYDPDTTDTLTVTVTPSDGNYTYQWYKDGATITGATSATIDVINVLDSGVYYCVVTNEYSTQATSDNINVTINKAKIDVSGLSWKQNQQYVYSGTQYELPLEGTYDTEKLTLSKSNYKYTGVKNLTAKLKITVKDAYKDNYEIEGAVADTPWSIVKKVIDVSQYQWPTTKEYTYTGETYTHRLVSEIDPMIKASYTSDSANGYLTKCTHAGNYIAQVTFSLASGYKEANVEISGSVADDNWKINPQVIDVSGYKWSTTSTFVYDGTEKSVTITDTPNEHFTISYTDNAKTNADNYHAVATITSDTADIVPSKTEFTKDWSITKATYDLTGVKWNYSTPYIYNGSEQKVEVTGLPTGVTVKNYTNNAKTDVGVYTATVEFNYDETNYNTPTLTSLPWKIDKATYDMSAVSFENVSYVYDGTEKEIVITGTLPAGVTAAYSNNKLTNAGETTATVTFTGNANYNDISSMQAKLTITKASYDMSNAKWNYTDAYTFNNNPQKVEVTGLPEGVTVKEYKNNEFTNAGSYKASVSFNYDNVNYNTPTMADVDWVINAIKIDVSAYTWTTNTTFTYDGQTHKVEIASAMHEMLEPHYIDNSKIAPGTYTAKVTFMLKQEALSNYEVVGTVANCEWTINEKGAPEIINEFDPIKDENGNVIIEVISKDGITDDHELVGKKDTEIEKPTKVDGKEVVVYDIYDIHFEKENSETKVTGKFQVKLLIPEELRNKKNIGVIHIDDDNNITFITEFERKGDYVEFETDGFSLYAVVEVKEALSIVVIIIIACLGLGLAIAIATFIHKLKEDEDGNMDPFFIKLASCKPEIKAYYYQLKSVVKSYENRIKGTINAYVESFEVLGDSLVTIEVKNARLVVRALDKKVIVNDSSSLNKGKKLLRKAFSSVDMSKTTR